MAPGGGLVAKALFGSLGIIRKMKPPTEMCKMLEIFSKIADNEKLAYGPMEDYGKLFGGAKPQFSVPNLNTRRISEWVMGGRGGGRRYRVSQWR